VVKVLYVQYVDLIGVRRPITLSLSNTEKFTQVKVKIHNLKLFKVLFLIFFFKELSGSICNP